MASKTKPDGRTINYVYDALNRLVERNYPDGTSDVFEYDQSGNLTGAANSSIVYYYSYDAANRMTGVTSYNLAQLFNIEYQYDSMGNRTKMTVKEGTGTPKTINYYYNANHQMTKMTSDMGNFTFVYDSLGRRIKRTLPNDTVTSYSYDPLSRLINITHKNAFQHTIDSFSYAYDHVGNRTVKKDNHKSIHYSYDPIYRLTRATPQGHHGYNHPDHSNGFKTELYSYDPVGNRNTGPQSMDGYAHNVGNELLNYSGHPNKGNNYEYDVNGNLIKKTEITGKWKVLTSYTYDDENRLITVTIRKGVKTREINFAYDPFGRRISKTVEREEFTGLDDNQDNGNHNGHGQDHHHGKYGHDNYPKTTFYIYDNQNIITEYDGNGKQTATYIHGPNIDEPLAAEIRNTRIYYHADGLGSITTLTNHMGHKVQQYDYDAFGNIKCTPFPHWIRQPFTYTGREFDYDTGLYYYRARYYDPQAGRFITKDPIGFEGGDINLYAYTKNNPVNYVDPDGERISVFTRSLDMKVKSGGYVHCVLIVEKCDGTKRTWDFQYDNQVYSPAKSPSNPIKNPKTTVVYDKYDLDDKVSAIADKMPHPDYSKTKYNCCYWVKDVLRWVGISWENPNPWPAN